MANLKIGEILKNIRIDHRYKQEYVAKVLGIKGNSYSQYENNINTPSLENMIKLAELYNCTIDDILNDNVPAPKRNTTKGE